MRIRRLFLILLLVLGIAGGALAYVAGEHGFTGRWRELITAEFERRGIHCDIGKLTIDPFAGLVARNIRLFEDAEHRTLLAHVNNITLDIDLARLIRAQQFLNTIDLRDADISMPVDPAAPDQDRIEVRNFSARIQMPENKIDVSAAEFEINGILVSVSGSLLQPTPTDESPEDRAARLRRRSQMLAGLRGHDGILWKVVTELDKFHFDKEAMPRIDLAVVGDLDDPENIRARLQFRATNAGRGNFYCDSVEASLRYEYPYLLVDQLDIRDSYGTLHAHATHRLGGDRIAFGLESSIDSHTLVRSIFDTKPLGEVIFYSPPKLHLDGEYFLPRSGAEGTPGSASHPAPGAADLPVHVIGGIDCGQFVSHGVIFEGLSVDFCIERDRKFFRNFVLDHKTGSLSGQVLVDGDALRYGGSLDMDPTVFIPFFKKEKTKAFLQRFRFGNSPSISVQFRGEGPLSDPPAWKTDGSATVANFHYNGVPAQSAVGDFSIRNRDHIYTNFRIDRREGHLTGDLIRIDHETKLTTIRNLTGSVFPGPTIAYVAPKIAPVLAPYRFPQPPTLAVNGTVDPVGGKATDLLVEFSAEAAQYEVLGKSLTLRNPTGRVRVQSSKVEPELTASVLGGTCAFTGNFSLVPGDTSYEARASVEQTSFRDIATVYEFNSETEGTVSGYFNFEGSGVEGAPIRGEGAATIYNGNVFSIPVFGPLSKFMGVLMPNANPGYSTAHEATARFTMADHVIHTRDISALTPAFKLSGSGNVHTVTRAINFDAEMNFRNTVASIVFFPVSKLLKYKGEGTLDDPRWRPVNFTLPRRDDVPGAAVADDPGDAATDDRSFLQKLPLPKLPLPKLPIPKFRDLIPGGE